MSPHVLPPFAVNSKSEQKVNSLPFEPVIFGMLAHLSDHSAKSHPKFHTHPVSLSHPTKENTPHAFHTGLTHLMCSTMIIIDAPGEEKKAQLLSELVVLFKTKSMNE
jgi:hypothetical protein